jgi:FtsP/CotA-like multicopper oxidase with cupredoxin domain
MKTNTINLLVCMFVILSVLPIMGTSGMTEDETDVFISDPEDQPGFLDPKTVPKYENKISGPPPVYVPKEIHRKGGEILQHEYNIQMLQFKQQILPQGYPETPVWGYGGVAMDSLTGKPLGFVKNSPGPTFEAIRGIPSQVTWRNMIRSEHMFPVDPTLHWADPNGIGTIEPPFEQYPPGYPYAQEPVPLIPHLHGGEVQSTSDGNPDSWFTFDGKHGHAYNTEEKTSPNSAVFEYPNTQPATTLWYHDHALGITRLNVMSGLAGFYLLRDPQDEVANLLPQDMYELPVVIQDRIFLENGEMYFPSEGNNPDIHPYWGPEFFGDSIMVNGLVWPNMDVHQGQYRLRLLDGSNARFYTLSFHVKIGEDEIGNPMDYGDMIPFTQIGSDGGYLRSAVELQELTIAPGERADILIDFSGLEPGTKVILRNSAYAPYKGGEPGGDPADPETVGQIMQFTVKEDQGFVAKNLPEPLNENLAGEWPTLTEVDNERTLVLVEVMSPADEPEEILLNGQKWGADITEMPYLGSTEDWVIVNPTEDTHPIHLHLTQFQLVSRQWLEDPEVYYDDWLSENSPYEPPFPNSHTPNELPVGQYLAGDPMIAPDNERGWKDTIQAHPGQVTVIRVRFSPIDGTADYPFDATKGPGYVWHCHILDHEDNEMMRPFIVIE